MSRRYWFQYNGAPGDEGLIGKYTLATSARPEDECTKGGLLCQVYLSGGKNPSAINSNILNYITTAKNTGTHRPNGSYQKAYVYTRSTNP